ncbi:MAG: glycosyltransferase [Lachnospiraceae bacterium]|uniref:Glycosyltransferase n=1 Tax=Candidatus Weimeria bifida TaxID=2599074 RepID=A0A6N7J1D7_9FIRM|nr:glycosyltransferase [Candidatus Weimeria bifida]RRF96440.1 MAG: glycosyltransferase [Lachnospiraceae bacterium]
MKPTISVIIPAYNIAGLLPGMVKDILGQPFKYFEIIIVLRKDDPDTAAAADELAKLDDRIRVIYRQSPGVSAARNAGIEAARGEYLVFPDGDDRVERGYIGTLFASIADSKKQKLVKDFKRIPVQLGIVGYDIVDQDQVVDETQEAVVRVMNKEDFLCRLFFQENYQGYIWNKIFKKSIIDKFNLRFDEKVYYREDQLFICRYVLHCKAIRYNPAHMYHYVQRPDSATALLEPENGVLDLRVLERQMTECRAFSKMRKLLKRHEDPKWYLEQEYVFYALEIFYRMRFVKDRSHFKNSYFRKIAKEVTDIEYCPVDDWEKEQLDSMREYANTGLVKENRNEG